MPKIQVYVSDEQLHKLLILCQRDSQKIAATARTLIQHQLKQLEEKGEFQKIEENKI